MNSKIKLTLIISFVVNILLFLLFSGVMMTVALSNAGMMGEGKMTGNSWMWIPTVLTLGLVFMTGWAIFAKAEEKI